MTEQTQVLARLDQISRQLAELASAVERLQPPIGVGGAIDIETSLGVGLSGAANVIPPTSEGVEIVGGEPTHEFPDCCAVGNDHDFYCTGTLIAPNVVVTADHCTGITRVFLGGTDVTRLHEGEILRVIEQFAHPEVDLRVLMLEQPSRVSPRHVAQESEVGNLQLVTLVGFGTIDRHGSVGYGQKQWVEVPVASLGCEEGTAPKQYGCLPGREIVAGHRGLGLDSCRGDSGGPLYIRSQNGDYYLLGATSRGVRQCFTTCGDGGIYVRVDLCLDWIRSVTGVEIEGPRD